MLNQKRFAVQFNDLRTIQMPLGALRDQEKLSAIVCDTTPPNKNSAGDALLCLKTMTVTQTPPNLFNKRAGQLQPAT